MEEFDEVSNCDFLNVKNNDEIKNSTNQERILFSDLILKVNEWGISQQRTLIISQKAIYNFHKMKMKRRIEFSQIKGISLSSSSDEFIVHNKTEYDYYFISIKKNTIIKCIASSYHNQMKNTLNLVLIAEESLKKYVTSKSDKKRNSNFSRMSDEGIIPFDEYAVKISKKSKSEQKEGTIFSNLSNFSKIKFDDFDIISVIGLGNYGKVYLVEFKLNKEIYAMKAIKKHVLIEEEVLEYTLNEKRILSQNNHPFLVNLIFCFQTQERIYFVMPYLIGGELFEHLKKVRIFNEEKTKFYCAQLALGLQYLHDSNIIYRDLKPENILIDEDGYIKITDFGLAKVLKDDEKATTFAGTNEYLAPEVISRDQGYNHKADWWSFGTLMYEMLYGRPPFYDKNVNVMFEKVQNEKLYFSKRVKTSNEAQDILTRLLEKNPKGRLSSLKEIKNHPFFKDVDFDAVYKKIVKPPFKPMVQNKKDIRNFDEEFTQVPKEQTDIAPSKIEIVKQNQEKFVEFDN